MHGYSGCKEQVQRMQGKHTYVVKRKKMVGGLISTEGRGRGGGGVKPKKEMFNQATVGDNPAGVR